MKIFIIIFLYCTVNIFAQNDWIKWGKANYSYQIKSMFQHRNYSLDEKNSERFLLKSIVDSYWLLISDVDGDNCSFNPTCSNFFLQSVDKTNIVQGSLMFFDRFTRDMDIFGKVGYYPRVSDGHFYDPTSLYLMNQDSIKYLPPSFVIKNE